MNCAQMYELGDKDIYKYHPWDPRNWSSASQFNVIFSIILLIDSILGFILALTPERAGYIWSFTSGTGIFELFFPIIVTLAILAISPVLNRDIDESPFFGAILIKIFLFLGSAQFTLLGIIGEFILDLGCSILIVTVLVFNILFDMDQPFNYINLMLLGLGFFVMQFILDIILLGWEISYAWILLILGGLAITILLLHQKKRLIGSILAIVLLILNNYILPMGISSLGVGSLILLSSSILLLISNIPGV